MTMFTDHLTAVAELRDTYEYVFEADHNDSVETMVFNVGVTLGAVGVLFPPLIQDEKAQALRNWVLAQTEEIH